jgi:hypothetical protein
MSIIEKNSQPFEPYARLLNIIGDQLITDKKVAVIEIIKNSYDADAQNVKVRFFNLGNYGKSYLTELEQPYIEIEDDGEGMTSEIIKNVWMRPATPVKIDKRKRNKSFTNRGRKIQGEKGIGRFAIHKLGEKIELFSKTEESDEIKLTLDFTEYDPEKIDLFNQPPTDYKLLKDVPNIWIIQAPPEKIQINGTLIRIFNLRERWDKNDLQELFQAVSKLIPPYDPKAKEFAIDIAKDFVIEISIDGSIFTAANNITFEEILESAPFRINGEISNNGELNLFYNSSLTNRKLKRTISIFDKEKLSNAGYDLHSNKQGKWFSRIREMNRTPNCGDFKFSLYAFDLTNREQLTRDMREFVKDNFIYVLRDGVRVFPFGEREYDWLELDKKRSVERAGFFPSYNDLIGFIYITREGNQYLLDATSRQGMRNIDGAYDDFKHYVLSIAEIFNAECKIDKLHVKIEKERPVKEASDILKKSYETLSNSLKKMNDIDTLQKANKFLDTYNEHTKLIKERMEIVEDLAGLGMAVEKASHDALMLLSKMRGNLKDFKIKTKNHDFTNTELLTLLNELDENLNFVYDEMQVIQPLFKFQRKAIQEVSIYQSIEKVTKYFRREIENKIVLKVLKDKDIVVKTNNGLVLQTIINILDNALYWVNKNQTKEKEIVFKINTKNSTLIIADNGPGIREDITPMIFQEFFSLKADGRGLGLYIVKEILLRISAEISIIQNNNHKLLPGANFLIKFKKEI